MRHDGQNFALNFTSASASSHTLTDLEPRQMKLLGRLVILNAGRGLLTDLSVGGEPILFGAGFPLEALKPGALVDEDSILAVAAGPNTPIELTATVTTASALAGYIGTDPVPGAIRRPIRRALADGELWGEPYFAWGLGEKEQATANTAETLSWNVKPPKAFHLERIVMCLYRSDGGAVNIGDFEITKFDIGGTPMFSRTGNCDALLLSPDNSDEDGLRINRDIDTTNAVEIEISTVAGGAGIKLAAQIGFWVS